MTIDKQGIMDDREKKIGNNKSLIIGEVMPFERARGQIQAGRP